MPATASNIEIVWTLSALIGLAVNLWAMFDAMYDLQALRRAVSTGLLRLSVAELGAREMVAKGNIRREALRIFVQLCFLAIGIVAALEPAHSPRRPSLVALTVTAGIVLAAASLIIGAFLDRIERQQLIAYITEHYVGAGGC